VTIKASTINGQRVSEDDLQLAMSELSRETALSLSEIHQRCIAQGEDRGTAAGWVRALSSVAIELRNAGQQPLPRQRGYLAGEIDSYVAKYPPYSADGRRLCLTAEAGSTISPEDAAQEILRLTMVHGANPRTRMNQAAAVNATLGTTREPVSLSQERLYEDSSALRLTAPTTTQAEADAEVMRLANSAHGRRFIDLARRDDGGRFSPVPPVGHSSRPHVRDTDAKDTGSSDLSQGVSLYNQAPGAVPDWSPKAEAELDSMPSSFRDCLTDELQAADAATDPSERTAHLMRAADHAASAGARHVHKELHAQVCAVTDAAASYVPSAQEAGQQVAGGIDVQAEVDRLSALAQAGSSGNRSDPPKGLARRNSESRAARPGHTSGNPAIRV